MWAVVSEENSKLNDEIAITSYNKIEVITKNKERKEIEIDTIKLQNRAGKGSSIMTMGLEDEIKEIIY